MVRPFKSSKSKSSKLKKPIIQGPSLSELPLPGNEVSNEIDN